MEIPSLDSKHSHLFPSWSSGCWKQELVVGEAMSIVAQPWEFCARPLAFRMEYNFFPLRPSSAALPARQPTLA